MKGSLQIIRMMGKLTIYTFVLAAVFFNVLLANKGHSQTKSVREVKISIDITDQSLTEALDIIENNSDYHFVYVKSELKVNGNIRINASVRNETIETLLLQISQQADVAFRQVNNQISVRNNPTLNDSQRIEVVIAQTVSGKVTDENGEPLPGATVLEKGTTNGTTTDIEGSFEFNASEDATLIISFVGYLSQEIAVNNRSIIDIQLKVDSEQLEEVVVVGYGTMRKSDLTGSVVKADIESFRESPNVNVAQSLQGSIPGLNIGQVDEAGQNPSISIRGQSTLSGVRSVLIVLDGIIFTGELSDLNPSDIESIEILKDASSKAIYGAQAANGVILVTSKKGKIDTKPVFQYTGAYTFQSIIPSLNSLNREEHIQKTKDRDWQIYYLAPDYLEPDPNFDVYRGFSGGTPEVYEGLENGTEFDWWDALTQVGLINTQNLSVSGSEKNLEYFVSAGLTDQQNIIKNDNFKRKTVRVNLSNQIFPWFNVGISSFGSFSDFSGASPDLYKLMIMPPVVTPHDNEGNLVLAPQGQQTPNPFLDIQADDSDKRNYLNANFFSVIDIPFVKGLSYRLNFGNNYSWDRHNYSNVYKGQSKAGEAYKITIDKYDWTFENILSYKRLISEKHSVDVTLLYGRREISYEDTEAYGSDFSTMKLGYNSLSIASNQNINSSAWNESYLYQMGRLNYRYNDRYLFTATLRRDGFSGFAQNNKFGYFPSIAAGWILSEEQFLNSDLIDQLKVRASWGTNGNLANRYSSLSRLEYYPAYVAGDGGSTILGQQVASLANSDLRWETTSGYNFGIDFSLFTNRIYGSIDYYITTTTDLIYALNLPEITGFDQIISNVGEIANKGIEFQMGGEIISKNDLTWNINFNLSANKNKIVSLLGLDNDGDGEEDDLTASGLFIGESIGSIYTYEEDGMVQIGDDNVPPGWLVGTYRIKDNNGDGFYDPADRVIIGREEPAYRFGILNRINYKNFELKFFINSVQGGKNGYLGRNDPSGQQSHFLSNSFREHDYWSPTNPNAKWKSLKDNAPIVYQTYDSRSFVRLQDISLAYRVEPEFLDKIGLRSCKIYLSGKNLWTLTDWIGYDPETGNGIDYGGRPVLKGYTMGIDLSF